MVGLLAVLARIVRNFLFIMAYIEYLDTLTVLFGIVSFLSLTWWLRQSKSSIPPGPWGWPLLGCLPNVAILKYRTGLPMPQLFASLAKKYGPVFSLDFAGKRIVVLNTYKYVKEAYNNPSLNDRPVGAQGQKAGPQGLGQSSGEPWKEQRRFTLAALRSFGVGKKSFKENISEEAQSLAEEITSLKGKSFDPCHFFNNATSNVICSVVFGKRFDYSDPDFERMTNLLSDNFKLAGGSSNGLAMFLPIAKYLNGGSHKKIIETRRSIMQFVIDRINEHKKDHISKDPRDYIDVYLDEIEQRQKVNRNSAVNDRNLPATVVNLFAAGTDTTSITLRWAVLYMAAFPKIQDRVHQELDSITGKDRIPRLADKKELPFTCATLLEVQRIASIAPLGGVPHMCGEDTTLGPYFIHKGALLMANLWAIHHDPDNWLKPDEFNPERFLDENGHLKEREDLIPFAIGRRICLGEHLAKMELYIIFTHLLHQFTIKKPKDSSPLSFTGQHGLVYAPQPFQLQFISRHS